jgi:hypothetical protein
MTARIEYNKSAAGACHAVRIGYNKSAAGACHDSPAWSEAECWVRRNKRASPSGTESSALIFTIVILSGALALFASAESKDLLSAGGGTMRACSRRTEPQILTSG